MGYEPCTEFLLFALYQNDAAKPGGPVGLPVAAFEQFCIDMAGCIGLPVQFVLLTNRFVLGEDSQLLSEREIRMRLAADLVDAETNRPVAVRLHAAPAHEYIAAALPEGLMSTTLLQWFDRFINVHNQEFAYPKLRQGRAALHKLAGSPGEEMLWLGTRNTRRWWVSKEAHAVEDLIFRSRLNHF